jgi:hypothetical protein
MSSSALRVACFALGVVIAAPGSFASGGLQHPETGRPDRGEFVNMRGCVHGSLLTSIRLDPGTVAGAPTGSNRYRMTGSKEIRSQLKKADGKMVDVTGRLKIDDQRAYVRSKKVGKTTLTVGGAEGKVSPLDEHPVADATLEVVGVEVVQTVCNAP